MNLVFLFSGFFTVLFYLKKLLYRVKKLIESIRIVAGDEAASCFVGVNSVLGPAGGGGSDASGGKDTVQGDIEVGKFTGKLSHNVDLGIKVLSEPVLVLCGKKEGLENEDLSVGLFLDLGEKEAEVLLEILIGQPGNTCICSVPDIVDADEQREKIGIQIGAVAIPSLGEIPCLLTADSVVVELKLTFGVAALDSFDSVANVAFAEVKGIAVISATGGDGITLENYSHNLSPLFFGAREPSYFCSGNECWRRTS